MNNILKLQYLDWIDSVKGFAILLVIVGHCIDGYRDAGIFKQYLAEFNAAHDFIYAFHMPLFFMISGYLFLYAYKDIEIKKLKAKLIDLIGVYFLFSFVQICVQILLKGNINRNLGVENILLLPIYTVPPYWYLYVLCFLYLLTYLLQKTVSINRVLMITLCLAFSSQYITTNALEMHHILYYWYFFALGGYLYGELNNICNKKRLS